MRCDNVINQDFKNRSASRVGRFFFVRRQGKDNNLFSDLPNNFSIQHEKNHFEVRFFVLQVICKYKHVYKRKYKKYRLIFANTALFLHNFTQTYTDILNDCRITSSAVKH